MTASDVLGSGLFSRLNHSFIAAGAAFVRVIHPVVIGCIGKSPRPSPHFPPQRGRQAPVDSVDETLKGRHKYPLLTI